MAAMDNKCVSHKWALVACAVGAVASGASASAESLNGRHATSASITSTQVAEVSGGRITDIRVEGAQRIEPATVRSYLALQPGDVFSQARVDQSLKALFATSFFTDVTIRQEGSVLVVALVENPIINRIAFEGNRRIKDEQIQSELQLRPRVVFTRNKAQSDVQRILDVYRRNGRFGATVEPKIIKLDQNRVDLVFEIDEGPRTAVGRINFVGNEKFSSSALREKIQTKESRWYRFMSSDDTYDPDRLTYDRELLRRFYLSEGYADFRVTSGVAELTPEQDTFIITFTIEEGERYKFGKVKLVSNLKGLDVEKVRSSVSAQEGDWYDANEVERTISKLTDSVTALQYPFVDIKPHIQRNREALLIDIGFEIAEGPRVFVEKIDITGNVRTMDKVIRREFLLSEGDPFNVSKLKRSEQRVRDLGYFEKVNITAVDGSQPDRQVIQVDIAEQSTGEISIGAGFSTADGPLADFSIRERNLLGRGQDVRIGAIIAGKRQEYDLSFTEPYFLERDLSAGFDLYRITRNNQTASSYDEQTTGTTLRLGYPLTERLRQKLTYSFYQTSITGIRSGASRYIREQEGTRNVSMVGQELIYDARNSKLNPTDGYYIRFGTDGAGLGGDAQFVRTRLSGGYYYPFFEKWVLNLNSEIGYIFGLGQKVSIADRYFLGGDSLRGFATAGIGPRDSASGDALGGKQYVRGTAEVDFPIGLPEEFGIGGHVFTDMGVLGGAENKGASVQSVDSLRVSSGIGLSWTSPLGPIRIDLATPLMKEPFDKTERFRFSFGTRF
ncbi:Outer membrane protein assembly factor BamA [Azospirillaceae bacterium]